MVSARYQVNGGGWLAWSLAPCQVGTPAPNVLPEGHLPFIKLPVGLLQEVAVQVEMKDGQVLESVFPRAAILMP